MSIYTDTHAYIHADRHIHIYIDTQAYTYADKYTYIPTHMHTYMQIDNSDAKPHDLCTPLERCAHMYE